MDWLPPSEPWRGLAASTVRAIGLLVVAFVFVGASGSFKAEASYDETSHVYDVLVITRVRADAIRAFDAASPPLNGARNESVSPPVDGSGPSTTSSSAFVATKAASGPVEGQAVYRVYGGDSAAGGASWSPTNPGNVVNFRNAAGLPSGGASSATNTGQFVIEGTIADPSKVVLVRNALPLDGMTGGLSEYIIPNWLDNGAINITRVSGANPRF